MAARPSLRLGRLLAGFDASIAEEGIARAARSVVTELGATVDVEGTCPNEGPVLVVTNHPGAYDAFAIMSALGRDDVAFVASDRAFLRAMPALCEHLIFVAEDSVIGRARGVRRALDWLERGHVLVQFGAGAIEPDARFPLRGGDIVGRWNEGTGMLAGLAARAGAAIVPCFVMGVHSPRAMRLLVVRWAERRGITTIAPLVQATLPGFRDVVITVRLGEPIAPALLHGEEDLVRTAILREEVASLGRRR